MSSRSTLAVSLALLFAGAASPVLAGDGYDRVHADTFGNLVIVDASGYKRIIVGQGHLAAELRDYTASGSDDSDTTEEGAGPEQVYGDGRYGRPCPAILVKGRSYMYGFDEGVIPLFGDRCL
jgi:hypothetical protein